jgi:uncharacterized membrane protein YsdA (DUF1294 family)
VGSIGVWRSIQSLFHNVRHSSYDIILIISTFLAIFLMVVIHRADIYFLI